MREYILEAPLTPPVNVSDAPERLMTLAKTCREIIADGKITPEEASALRRWLQAAGWLKKFWPANAIAVRVHRLLEPLPTEKELAELHDFLTGVVESSSTVDCEEQEGLFDQPVPRIVFQDKTFCLTGIFFYGSRSECEEAVRERGGILRRAVSGSTNYVVIGGICNPQWKFADSGTKIEAARMHRSEALEWNRDLPRSPKNVLAIVRERDWLESLGTELFAE